MLLANGTVLTFLDEFLAMDLPADGWLRVVGFKVFAAGAIAGWTAFLSEPYEGADDRGILAADPAEIRRRIAPIHRRVPGLCPRQRRRSHRYRPGRHRGGRPSRSPPRSTTPAGTRHGPHPGTRRADPPVGSGGVLCILRVAPRRKDARLRPTHRGDVRPPLVPGCGRGGGGGAQPEAGAARRLGAGCRDRGVAGDEARWSGARGNRPLPPSGTTPTTTHSSFSTVPAREAAKPGSTAAGAQVPPERVQRQRADRRPRSLRRRR